MQCPQCQAECAEGAKFCGHCGAVLGSGKAQPAAGRGERKQVTVLFADLSGYTAMTEALDAEDVKEIMGASSSASPGWSPATRAPSKSSWAIR